jgi:aminopeptidase N
VAILGHRIARFDREHQIAEMPTRPLVHSIRNLLLCAALPACLTTDATDGSDASDGGDTVVARGQPATPGAPDIGDPLFPGLGNGGYDVQHYHLDLRYATAAPDQPLDGTVTILARATQALSRFDLDFAGDSLAAVAVDGRPAAFTWDGSELVITPARAIRDGALFTVTVSHFVAHPKVVDPAVLLGAPFFQSPDGSAWALQPGNAHTVFPSNDHPSDKASYSFLLDVPAGTTAVANGERIAALTLGGRSLSLYDQPEPMASELATVAVGAFTVTDRGRHAGVHVRDVTPTRLTAELAPRLALETAQLDFLTARLGPYPFHSYGSLVVEAPLNFALECQTLSLYDGRLFGSDDPATFGPVTAHELAHQWFGDSVSPGRWENVWLSEGHAAWYELEWQLGVDSAAWIARARQFYSFADLLRVFVAPVASPKSGEVLELFNSNVYQGGFLVLMALRQQVGDAAFRAIERAWVTRFRGRSATTDDFIALASEVSGQDLDGFLRDWLFGTKTPPMPGFPDFVAIDPGSFLAAPQLPIEPKR